MLQQVELCGLLKSGKSAWQDKLTLFAVKARQAADELHCQDSTRGNAASADLSAFTAIPIFNRESYNRERNSANFNLPSLEYKP